MKRYSYQQQVDRIKIQLNEGVVPAKYDKPKPENSNSDTFLNPPPGQLGKDFADQIKNQGTSRPGMFSAEMGGYGWGQGERDPRDEPLGRMKEAQSRKGTGDDSAHVAFKMASDDYRALRSKLENEAKTDTRYSDQERADSLKDLEDYDRVNVQPMGAFPWKKLAGAAADIAIAYAIGKVGGGGGRLPSAVRNTTVGRAMSSVGGVPSSFGRAIGNVVNNTTDKTRQAAEDLRDRTLGVPTRAEVQKDQPWRTDADNTAIRRAMRQSIATTVGQPPSQRGAKLISKVLDAQNLELKPGFELRQSPTDRLAGTTQPLGKGDSVFVDKIRERKTQGPISEFQRPERANEPRRSRDNLTGEESAKTRIPYPKEGNTAYTLEVGGKPFDSSKDGIDLGKLGLPTHVQIPHNTTMTTSIVPSSDPRMSYPSSNVIQMQIDKLLGSNIRSKGSQTKVVPWDYEIHKLSPYLDNDVRTK